MASNLLSIFAPQKRDILFETAMSATNSIKSLISLKNESSEGLEIDKQIFHKIFHNDPTSPSIYWLETNQFVIYYPPNSTPYNHSFDDKCKFIQCMSGIIYDKNSERKLLKGDKIKIYPGDNYSPYTMEKSCYLRVCVGSCDNLLDQVCI